MNEMDIALICKALGRCKQTEDCKNVIGRRKVRLQVAGIIRNYATDFISPYENFM